MIIKCIASVPNHSQAKLLGDYFRPGEQEFGLEVGQQYLVFSLKTRGGLPWVEIVDSSSYPGYLFAAPLLLFEVVDPRVSAFWEVRYTKTGEVTAAPPSLFRKYYHDDLFEGKPETVEDFLKVRAQLEKEAGLPTSTT